MRLWSQAILILMVGGIAALGWALYLPSARPFLDRIGALQALEQVGLVNAAQLAPQDDGPRRGGAPAPVVVAMPVSERVMNDRTLAIGTTQSARSVVLATDIAGQLARLNVASGAYVEKGTILVELDDRAARIALARAELQLEDERSKVERLTRLRGSGAVTELQRQEAEVALAAAELALREAEFQLGRHRLAAPIDGWVGLLAVSEGDLVSTGTRITTIEDRSALLVEFRVPERMAARIRTGDTVAAAALADPGRALQGTISAIDNRVDEANRSLRVQATLANEDDGLRPGMAISLTLDLVGATYPAIDPLAIQWGTSGAYVWILREGKARQLPIRIVQRNEADALVEAEFAAGDLVVTEGVMTLRPGQEAVVAGEAGG